MPRLVQLLRSQDLGYVRIVGGLWGLDLRARDLNSSAEDAAAQMLDEQLANEIVESLEQGARAALNALLQAGGRMPWAAFARQFGEVREMGAGRRDREEPHLHPGSAAETLFYRALLGRAFLDTDRGPQEFAYVPADLLDLIRREARAAAVVEPPGRAAPPADRAHVRPASDGILDEATTFLAGLRTGTAVGEDAVLRAMLESAGVIRGRTLQAARAKTFLEMPRAEAMQLLTDAWRASENFDELRLMPGLVCEGTWINRPRAAREFLLAQVAGVPAETWWSLPAFIGHIKENQPDFQRPAGDYDSWFIKRAADGTYLRGFPSWDEVDGALIRFTISGVMHRLGLVDLAGSTTDGMALAFRIVRPGRLRAGEENGTLHISSQGRIAAGRRVPRVARYQLARFAQWDEPKADEFRYHLTPASLTRAAGQGLKIEHLLALLHKHCEAGIPPALVKALKRWEQNGTEARVESEVVLRVSSPELLQKLRKSKASRYLGQALGPTSVIVKEGAVHRVSDAMAELGVLMEDRTSPAI